MKKTVAYIALGVCTYLVFLMVLFPADRAYAWAKSALGSNALYDVRGTVWRGKAAAATINGKVLRGLRWQVRPWTVVLGRVDVGMAFDNGETWAKGTLGLTATKTLRFDDLELQVPASEIKPMLPPLPMDLGGVVSVALTEGRFDPEANRLTAIAGTATWHEASVAMGSPASLGTFQLAMTSAPDGINGKLKDDGKGPLEADGTVLLKPDNTYQFTGTVAVRDQSRSDLIQALRFLGKQETDGRVKISYSGKL